MVLNVRYVNSHNPNKFHETNKNKFLLALLLVYDRGSVVYFKYFC